MKELFCGSLLNIFFNINFNSYILVIDNKYLMIVQLMVIFVSWALSKSSWLKTYHISLNREKYPEGELQLYFVISFLDKGINFSWCDSHCFLLFCWYKFFHTINACWEKCLSSFLANWPRQIAWEAI